MTYRKLLKDISTQLKEAKIASADLDARVLMKHVLQIDDTTILKNLDQTINQKSVLKIQELIKRRAQNEPIAYLTKQKEFYGLNFFINNNVLVPRPETEFLVQEGLKFLQSTANSEPLTVIDIGTGSGNVIISIVKTLSTTHRPLPPIFFATDISPEALKVAIHNSKQNGVANKIKFFESDLFSNLELPKKFDLIIANLPYVPEDEVDESVKFEPVNAIFADDNGAEIIKRFLVDAKNYLNAKGTILIELDPRNALEIKNCAKENFPNAIIELEKDLAKLNRYLTIRFNK